MIKKIVIRVIVAVSVAFILSKFKVLNIMSVSAMEVKSSVPQDMYVYKNYEIFRGYSSLNQYSILNKNYYGMTVTDTNTFFSAVSFKSTFSDINKVGNLQAVFFSNTRVNGNSFPIRAYVINDLEDTMICNVESNPTYLGNAGATNPGGNSSSYLTTISCPNVRIGSNGVVRLFVQGDFQLTQSNFFSLTTMTMYFDDTNSTLQEIENNTDRQATAQEEMNDFLKDDTPVSDDSINDVLSSADESNSPISDLVSMPLTLLQKINTGMNGSCSPFVLGSLLGTTLSLPCINLGTRLGTLWNIIDMCMSVFMAYTIGMMCIRIYNNFTTLKDNSNDVYGGDI